MNLIVNRHLDSAQEKVIHELTMKKRQSKKSTMSAKQVAARQRLARELMHERLIPTLESIHLKLAAADGLKLAELAHSAPAAGQLEPGENQNDLSTATECSQSLDESLKAVSFRVSTKLAYRANSSTGAGSSSLSLQSDGSFSGSSSADQSSQMIEELDDKSKQASIKYNNHRLEQLNSELDYRLRQYEYLVAQEKALLGNYNMLLFTNQGINNFHQKSKYC